MPEELKDVFYDINNRADEIYSQSAYTMEELHPNHILRADENLLDKVYRETVSGK